MLKRKTDEQRAADRQRKEAARAEAARIIVAMVGSTTSKKANDPTAILNAICRERWKLVNGSFVFVEEGQQSRDKFMSSGQNVATKGTTFGYYLFKRCEANRREPEAAPWDAALRPAS